MATLQPRAVILFGSLAKGDFTQHSDADILVVTDAAADWLDVYAHSDGIVQPVVKTVAEMHAQIAEGNTFLIEAVEDGAPLLDRDGAFADLRRRCQEAKARLGLERIAGGWRIGAKRQH